MKMNFDYISEDMDRHGNVRIYYRRKGKRKIRLREPVGSPEFFEEYKAARAGNIAPASKASRAERPKAGTMHWLCVQYYKSAEFKLLDPRTRKVRRRTLDRFCENDGDKPFALLEGKHLRKRRDDMIETPEAANAMLKALRQVFAVAIEYDHADRNPARDVPYIRTGSQGFHSWTLEEVEQFETAHPVGTKARLALALLLYTGQRRSDVVQFGRQHVRDGWLNFTQHKGRNKKPVTLAIPIVPDLQSIIGASPCGDLAFIVTAFDRPFTSNGFGNRFRKWCDAAGLPHCSAHGLRKAACARMAELGCTEFEIAAVTGHQTLKEVVRYTRAARQKIRAASAMAKYSGGQLANESVPLSGVVGEGGTVLHPKSLKRKGA